MRVAPKDGTIMPPNDSAKPPRSSFVSATLRDVRVWHVAIVVAVTYFSHLHFSFRRDKEPTA